MILVDTNILSELMRPNPNHSVVIWLNEQDSADLYCSTITLAEIQFGLNLMPNGKRHKSLSAAFQTFKENIFGSRILSFNQAAATSYANIRAERQQIGQPIASLDAQIAAIAQVNNCAIATRNTKDFTHINIALINPFE